MFEVQECVLPGVHRPMAAERPLLRESVPTPVQGRPVHDDIGPLQVPTREPLPHQVPQQPEWVRGARALRRASRARESMPVRVGNVLEFRL